MSNEFDKTKGQQQNPNRPQQQPGQKTGYNQPAGGQKGGYNPNQKDKDDTDRR